MNVMMTGMRRVLWLALIGAAGGGVWTWQRNRTAVPAPPSPPVWPPLPTTEPTTPTESATPSSPVPSSATDDAVNNAEHDDNSTNTTSSGAAAFDGVSTASVVNALVDAPDARSTPASGTWVAPNDDGSCPTTHPIKANDNSGIFHVPGGRFHERTKAERCYVTPDDATADGYRQAKS